MKNFLSKLWSSVAGSQRNDVEFDRRLTVGSPSGFTINWTLKLVSVLVLVLFLGIGNAWGAITDNNDGTYKEPSGTGTYSGSGNTGIITWSFAGGNVTVVQNKGKSGTNVNSSYAEAARVYQYQYLNCEASNGFKISKVEINYTTTYKGAGVAGGSSISNNVVGGTTNVTTSLATTSGGTHSFTPKTDDAKTQMYIQNCQNGTTNTQLRWASGKLYITYFYTAPTAVAQGTVTSNNFSLSITDALNTNKYDVYFSTSSTAPTATTTATVANQTTKTPTISTGVSAGQTYYVWVRSVKTISSNTWKSAWVALPGTITTPSAGTSVTLSKAGETNGSFTLSNNGPLNTTSAAQSITVTATPNAGYYLSSLTASNPTTGTASVTGSGNTRTVTYSSGANGSSTITATFSAISRTISYSGDTHISSYTTKPTSATIEDDDITVEYTVASGYLITDVTATMGGSAIDASDIEFDQTMVYIVPTGGITGDIAITFTIAEAGGYCISAFNSSNDGITAGFSNGGSGNEYTLSYTIPGKDGSSNWPQYWIGENNAWSGTFSANATFADMKVTACDATIGLAEGATGKLHIWDDNKASGSNLWVRFEPSGYGLRWGTDGGDWSGAANTEAFAVDDDDDNVYWTDFVTLDASNKTWKYYVGLKTASGYVYSGVDNEASDSRGISRTRSVTAMKVSNGTAGSWKATYLSSEPTGSRGKFRLWNNNTDDYNFNCHWVPFYQLTYDANGGSGSMSPLPATPVSCEESAANRTVTVGACTFTAPTGKVFKEWNTQADGGGTTVSTGNKELTSDVKLYAIWENATYTITTTLSNVTISSTISSSYTYTGSAANIARTFTAISGYILPANITVTMGGAALTKGTGYTYDSSTGAFNLAATITGNVVITVTGVRADTYKSALHTSETGWTSYASGVTKTGTYTVPNPGSVDASTGCEGLHYHFAGWVTEANKEAGTIAGNIIAASGSKTADGTTYWAVWEKLAVGGREEGWYETDIDDLTGSDVFVIVGSKSTNSYAMSNNNGTTSAPTASSVTISEGAITTTVTDAMKWNISGNSTDGYVFYPNGSTTTWLYCTAANNGVRVGTTNDNKAFTINSNYLYNNGTSRYVGIYNSSDWRCYTSINDNIKEQTFAFYAYVASSLEDPIVECVTCAVDPAVGAASSSAENVCGATIGCTGITKGDCDIDEWGFVYGTTTEPTGNAIKKGENSTTDVTAFNHTLTGLTQGTKYYVRAYAKVGATIVYGTETSFTTMSITAQSNNASYGTVSITGNVITGSPKSGYTYAASAYTVTGASDGSTTTVTKVENAFTVSSNSTTNITVTINYVIIPTDRFIDAVHSTSGYTGTGMAKEGDYSASVPVLTDKTRATTGTCEQLHYHFAGWVAAAYKDDPSGHIAVLDGTPTNTTYYAVWEQEDLGGDEVIEVFREEFNAATGNDGNTGGNDGAWNGTVGSATWAADNDGWVSSYKYGADHCAKFGSGSYNGAPTTPTISIKSAVSAVLIFKAGAWDNKDDGTTLNLSATNCSLGTTSVTMEKGAWKVFTSNISSITDDTKITFTPSGGTKYRFFLDSVIVKATFHTYEEPIAECVEVTCGKPTSATNTSVTAYGATIGWTASGTGTADHYEYAVWENGAAEPTSDYLSTTSTSVAITGKLSGTTYRWKVRQVCSGGDGNSTWLKSSFTTSDVPVSFSVPTGVSSVSNQTTATALPSAGKPDACGDCWVFMGWTTAAYDGSALPARFFQAGEIAHLTNADGTTLYAVYGKAEYVLIGSTEYLVDGDNYVLTYIYNDAELALANTDYGNGARTTDVTDLIREYADGYFIYNPSAANVWRFTGTASSGQLYNAAASKYVNLTSTGEKMLNATDNLTFSVEDLGWTIKSTNYLNANVAPQQIFDAAAAKGAKKIYMYQQESATYSTTPDCETYEVAWLVGGESHTDGSPTEETNTCAGIEAMPDDPDDAALACAEVFMGWSESDITGTGNAAPSDLFVEAGDAPRITENKTFYAVFASVDPENEIPTSITSTFTSASWEDEESLWTSGTNGAGFTANQGVQILGITTAYATTKASYNKVDSVWVTYCTNKSAGAGKVKIEVNSTKIDELDAAYDAGDADGRTAIKTLKFKSATPLTGTVKITATGSTNSIFIGSVQIFYRTVAHKDYMTYCTNEFTDAAPADHNWSTAGNWSMTTVPTINERAVINKPVTVDVATAKAKEVVLNQSSTNTGSLEISAGKALTVAETVQKTTDGSTLVATGENDIVFGSTLAAGTGALVAGGYTSGDNKATVNFAVKAKKDGSGHWINQYIGTPFNDQGAVLYNYYGTQLYAFHPTNDGNYDSGTGSANDAWWSRLAETDGMNPFVGYNILCSKAETPVLWMQGTLNASDNQTINGSKLVYNGTSNTENLLANSWMAPIHIEAFENSDFTNVEKTIYIFNAGSPEDYAAHTDDGAASATAAGQYIVLPIASAPWVSPTVRVIPAMQAFSVYATGANPSLTLDYNRLVYTPALTSVGVVPTRAPHRDKVAEDAPEVISLHVTAGSGYAANAYILGREDFADSFDDGWDGRFMEGDEAAPQLYAPTENGNLVINCVPNIEGTVVCFKRGSVDSEYTFTFDYEGEESWYLNDQKEQESTLISALDSYTFHSSADDMPARFVVSRTPIYKTPTGVEDADVRNQKSDVRKIVIDDHVFIIRNGLMYDVTGALCK